MVAYLTPDQAVGGSSPSVFIFIELNNFRFFGYKFILWRNLIFKEKESFHFNKKINLDNLL